MRRIALLLLAAGAAWAGVDGTVVNQTTGKPQPGAVVTFFKVGQAGPEALETVKSDAQGKFRFESSLQMGGPSLIRTAYNDVLYNKLLTPGSPSSGIEIPVYDSSAKVPQAQVSQHVLVLEPNGQTVSVSETFMFKNDGKVTYNDPKNGTLRFFLPEAANGKVRVSATEPGGLPVEHAAEKTRQPGVYMLDLPIKPGGETRIDVTYTSGLSDRGTFSGKSLYKTVPTRLAVPNGVTLDGPGLESLGADPNTQATIYGTSGEEFTVAVKGTGSMRAAESGGDDSGPQISQILPRPYDNLAWILSPALLVLAFGFLLLYRKGSAQMARK